MIPNPVAFIIIVVLVAFALGAWISPFWLLLLLALFLLAL